MRKVLWLASWYPNAMEPFSGDFIRRQAEAVSIFQPLTVLFVGKYSQDSKNGEKKIRDGMEVSGTLEECIFYYQTKGINNHLFQGIQSGYAYFKKQTEFIRQLRLKNQLPDLVHVQVAMKAGLLAVYLKWKYKIPFVLTEHWTGYFAGTKDGLNRKSLLMRFLTKLVIKNAERLLPVSDSLGCQIRDNWAVVPFQKIPNVVNTKYFYPSKTEPEGEFIFIHISTLLYPKNPEGIIRSFKKLLSQGIQASLVLVGPLNPQLQRLVSEPGLSTGKIICTGEIPYEQVAIELRKSSALVMFSDYENMPCVVIEALCTGLPVIASRVGGLPEVVGENNGILVAAGNENELLEAMKKMIAQYHIYKKDIISQQATAQFSYEKIGRQIIQVYDDVLKQA
jgi:glycosyltransferase involved in cell wall biosynthesis